MRNIIPILSVAMLVISSCSPSTRTADGKEAKTDSVTTPATEQSAAKPLFATLRMKNNIKAGDSVKLKFTVYNQADSVQQFCKWHTPFEPLMSKYLDVTSETGEEASYKGPMAKRVMPPPADSYVKINPGDSLSMDVDVLKAYAIKTPGKYTVKYNAQNISGLIVKDSISFIYAKP